MIDKSFFVAWNMDTKQLVCPTMTFDNEVLAIAEGPTPTQAFVAGRFGKITGADGVVRTRSKLALIDLSTCSVDPTGRAYKSGTTLAYPATQSAGTGYGIPNFKTA